MLSHDVDLLRSNDSLTQLIRIKRFFNSVIRGDFQQSKRHVFAFLRSLFFPYRNYLNSIFGMIDLEKQYGFKSSFYFLVGSTGRYGPRTSCKKTLSIAKQIPDEWNVGIHYNFDSFKKKQSLDKQIQNFNNCLNKKINSGRAHYFIFDFFKDALILSNNNIKIDESLSWHDSLGFKFGISGPLIHKNKNVKTIFLPTTYMDQILEIENNIQFLSSYKHLKKLRSRLLLIHNDIFFNPENSFYIGKYQKLLKQFYKDNLKSILLQKFTGYVNLPNLLIFNNFKKYFIKKTN